MIPKHFLIKFLKQHHSIFFEEFHWLLSDDSWEMLKNLALKHEDEYILMVVLDNQKSMGDFCRDSSYHYWVKIPLNISSKASF